MKKLINDTIILFLAAITTILFLVILYQRFTFSHGIQSDLKEITNTLYNILETDSDEKVMVFTDNKVLMELCVQINSILTDRQKLKADYKHNELSSKKMLSNISHDIKTPLTVILGYLEIMRLNNKDNEMLQKTEAKAKQVMELINCFFTLAKIEARDNNISLRKLNINEVLKENVLSFYDILIQKNFTVEIEIPETAIFVYGDKAAIQRILSNLISNVIRYGIDGEYLGISLHDDESNVYIDITDKGKGIKKEFIPNVFERLYTMEDSRNRNIQGNGLGLTIAKNLALQLGGDIYLKSTPNIKTTFTLKLKKFLY